MKAVILAGGEGSRLRPLTLGRPKPMTSLFGKPVLGHILDLLRLSGVTDAAVTLRYLPAAVIDYFGDGSEYGMRLRYFVEDAPLGTAGGVKKCMDFLGEEDFLVISGDAVCDLDLKALLALHKSRRAVASLALCRRDEPLEYGLVRTDRENRVLGFVEKPGWGQVDTELVNTGIYVLSKRAMDLVPENVPYDFGKELFPALLSAGEPLYGWEVPGYWQDMGDCGAYLECVQDALSGKVSLDLTAGQTSAPIPAGVEVRRPCWIGKRVSLAPGCIIGPYTVLGGGSAVETGALVERSVLLGAAVGEGAEVSGAILCKNSAVHARAMVGPGAVLGEGAVAGSEAIVAPGVKLWPGRRAAEGSRCTSSLVSAGGDEPLKFTAGGAIRGVVEEDLSAASMLSLGALLGEKGPVGISWAGGNGAGMLARAVSCGVTAAGGLALMSDAPCASAGAWLGQYYGLPTSLFIQQDGDRAEVRLFDSRGLPLARSEQRKLEGALLRGEGSRVSGARVGGVETVAGTRSSYAAECARPLGANDQPSHLPDVAVERGEGANAVLAAALAALGCRVQRGVNKGVPTFSADWGGFRLTAWDEKGKLLSPDCLLVLLTRIELTDGEGQAALPAWAPAAAETVARHRGGRLLRLGRDGAEAEELWQRQPWFRDAIFAACRICRRMGRTGESLEQLCHGLPQFATVRREVPIRTGRGRVMGGVLRSMPAARSQGEGVRLPSGDGWVYVVPSGSRSALRLIAESVSTEAAEELCAQMEKRLRELDEEKS